MNYHGGDIYGYDRGMIDFSSNVNPLGVPESFREAVMKDLSCLTRYPDRQYRKLKSSLLQYLQLQEDEKGIVLGNGAVELIYKTLQVLPVKNVIIASPTFSEYRRAAMKWGLPVEEAVLYDPAGRLQTDDLISRITEHDLVILCNPNNPTGTLTPRTDLKRIMDALSATKGFLLVDETFIEFSSSYPHNSLVSESMENLIVIRALTKYFGMPGIRLGYAVLKNPGVQEMLEESMEPWHINAMADLAGQTVLKDHGYMEDTRRWIREEREFMCSELAKLKYFTFLPTESNFILMYSGRQKAQEIQDILTPKGILIRLPIGFAGLDDYAFRIAIKDRASNTILLSEMNDIDKNI